MPYTASHCLNSASISGGMLVFLGVVKKRANLGNS